MRGGSEWCGNVRAVLPRLLLSLSLPLLLPACGSDLSLLSTEPPPELSTAGCEDSSSRSGVPLVWCSAVGGTCASRAACMAIGGGDEDGGDGDQGGGEDKGKGKGGGNGNGNGNGGNGNGGSNGNGGNGNGNGNGGGQGGG